jgi:hypothetical protein
LLLLRAVLLIVQRGGFQRRRRTFHDDWYWPPRHDVARWWQSEQPRLWNGPRRSVSKISYSKHLLLVCGTFGCRELSIEHTTWSAFCILRSLPPHEWPSKKTDRVVEAVRRTPEGARRYHRQRTFLCSCFGVGCVRSCRLCGEAASKDDDELLAW